MKVLLSIMSEKQWTPFYLNPSESANLFELDIFLIRIQSRLESLGVPAKMAYMERVHPKGVPFSGFEYMRGLGFHLLKYMKG